MKLNNKAASILGIAGFTGSTCKTPVGNGTAVPQYKIDEKGQVKPVVDKNGEVVTHNLQEDINKLAPGADYKRLIKSGGVINTSIDWKDTDYSQLGTATELLRVKNELDARGISLEQLQAVYSAIAAAKAKVEQPKKQEPEQKEVKDEQPKEVK